MSFFFFFKINKGKWAFQGQKTFTFHLRQSLQGCFTGMDIFPSKRLFIISCVNAFEHWLSDGLCSKQ